MFLLWHPSLTAINLSYTFPILETSTTALCGTTGILYVYICIYYIHLYIYIYVYRLILYYTTILPYPTCLHGLYRCHPFSRSRHREGHRFGTSVAVNGNWNWPTGSTGFQEDGGIWRNYCWWTRSCTTKEDDYPIIYRALNIPGGCLGFLNHQQYGVGPSDRYTPWKIFPAGGCLQPSPI